MAPKRKAAASNTRVASTKRSRVNKESSRDGPNVGYRTEDDELRMSQASLQTLIREAFEAGVKEAKSATAVAHTTPTSSSASFALGSPDQAPPDRQYGTATSTDTTDTLIPALTIKEAIGGSINPGIIISESNAPAEVFFSTGIPLTDMVDTKTKDKIWNNEFVEMSSITSGQESSSYQMVVSGEKGAPSAIELTPKQKSTKITINEWTYAFQIYMAVYCQKYPSEFAILLKYSSMISKLNQKGGNWAFYDRAFRRLREKRQSLQWDVVERELWDEALSGNGTGFLSRWGPKTNQASTNAVYPPGYCWKFIDNIPCPGGFKCRYLHACHKCQGNHRPVFCNQGRQNSITVHRSHLSQGPSFPKPNFQNPPSFTRSYNPNFAQGFRHPFRNEGVPSSPRIPFGNRGFQRQRESKPSRYPN